jgi:hypothetical protein
MIAEELEPLVIERYVDNKPGYDGQKVAYGVVRNGEGKRFGLVVLYEYKPGRFNFGTKLMSSDMGPNYYDFPAEWLALLDAPETDWDREWRARVAKEAA